MTYGSLKVTFFWAAGKKTLEEEEEEEEEEAEAEEVCCWAFEVVFLIVVVFFVVVVFILVFPEFPELPVLPELPGTHWEYQSLKYLQVYPDIQHLSPVKLSLKYWKKKKKLLNLIKYWRIIFT